MFRIAILVFRKKFTCCIFWIYLSNLRRSCLARIYTEGSITWPATMRTNLPVTNTEYRLIDGKTIVSTTDLQGNITYANPYFIQVSGFTEAELIGAPQNIVRHPDMPIEAFADLWKTIKSGAPWTGLVKNRCKNGDYYWVAANVTAVVKSGKIVGFMSVRTKPSQAEIAAAKDLYAGFKAGNMAKISINEGKAQSSSFLLRVKTALSMSLIRQIDIGFAILGTFLAALAAISLYRNESAALPIASIICLIICSSLWVSLRTNVMGIRTAVTLARRMAGGDLTGQVDRIADNEIGHLLKALRQTNVNLHSIISDIRGNFDEIRVATQEIASGNLDLSGRTEAQASSLEETASSMEELTNNVQQNSTSVINANKLAIRASDLATTGGKTVKEMVTTMGLISDSSRRVLDIIGLIDSIAFQTNILALNAAVEAARAGEHGRGFAVVAAEVRQLAQRTAVAAKDVKNLIDVSLSNIDAGAKLTDSAGSNMSEVIGAVSSVKHVMDEIAATAAEQSSGITQVNQAVGQMDEITQQNAALVEQAAAAAASLAEQTDSIANALAVFQLTKA